MSSPLVLLQHLRFVDQVRCPVMQINGPPLINFHDESVITGDQSRKKTPVRKRMKFFNGSLLFLVDFYSKTQSRGHVGA